MATKIGKAKSERRAVSGVSNEDLLKVTRSGRGRDADKARKELVKRGVEF